MPLPILLAKRSSGESQSFLFRDEVAVQKSQLELQDSPRVASPHVGAIPALKVDRVEGRFLLSGSVDATISVYDLSKWGTQNYLQKKGPSDGNDLYVPVARSVRSPYVDDDVAETPPGHSHSVVSVLWYVDSGAFISASAEGSILVWDTHAMEPVIRWKPLPSISCMNLSTASQGRSESLVAVGSTDDEFVRLMDIRSGAASHSLVGHKAGITCVHWSPASDVIVASGSLDKTIRLWDIRKPGSRSCVAVLDRDTPVNKTRRYRHFRPSYAHLSGPFHDEASPNNYGNSNDNAIVSHEGSISALSFTSDGSSLVSTATDGKLQVWDLLGSGHVLPLNFSYRPNQPAVSRNRTRVPLVLQDCGKETTAWVGHGSQVLGYSLQRGGRPTQILDGHMDAVTSLEYVSHSMQILSGSIDGMILGWSPKKRRRGEREKRVREDGNGDKDTW